MGEGKKTLMKKIEMMHDEIDIKDVLEYQTIWLQVATQGVGSCFITSHSWLKPETTAGPSVVATLNNVAIC